MVRQVGAHRRTASCFLVDEVELESERHLFGDST